MNIRFNVLILLFFFSFFLVWCKSSTSVSIQNTQVSNFLLPLDVSFIPVNSVLLENKQIINKVLWSWKKVNKTWFETSLVFTKSIIDPLLQLEQFVILNQKKFTSQLPWFISWWKELVFLACNESSIKGMWIEFSIKNWLLDDFETLHFGQLQFVYNGQWFILSFVSNLSTDVNIIKKTISSISCL
jgi:hypothetical protein